jgi:nickel/cobalt exporter
LPCFLKLALLTGLLLIGIEATALAQGAHQPFAIGANEGGVGHQNALGAWILGEEGRFYRLLTSAIRATRDSAWGAFGLIGISFAYGVFHAAGPGHGKAVVASYMISNEVALRRGLVIACLAALLQGVVAVVLIGAAAVIFHATAQRMTAAAGWLEVASYCGIVALGLVLVWRKGRAVVFALRPTPAPSLILASAATTPMMFDAPAAGSSRFSVDDGSAPHVHGPDCGHVHMPDPSALSAASFNWKVAAMTVLTAGARPCSGAILVLVFALAQGMFWAGVGATFAMAAGTAITTGTLAIAAVFAKDLAVRMSGGSSPRGALVGRVVELVAAACVLAFGLALLAAALSGAHVKA